MSARTFVLFMVAISLIGLLAYGLSVKSPDSLAAGDPIPDGELPVLGASETGSIADYRSEWVLVNVWASWCLPCRDEAPALQAFQERHGEQSFTIVGVDTQDGSDDALAFVEEFGLTYLQLRDGSGEFAKEELETTGVPESFLVDPEGDLAAHFNGPLSAEHLRTCVAPSIGADEPRLERCTFPGYAGAAG